MTTFKIGDRVRLVAPDEVTEGAGYTAGLEGVVKEIAGPDKTIVHFDTTVYTVVFEGDHEDDAIGLYGSEIELIVEDKMVPIGTRVRITVQENGSVYEAEQLCTIVGHIGNLYDLKSDDHSFTQVLKREHFEVSQAPAKAVEPRMAKVGDRIRITNPQDPHHYARGDIGVVNRLWNKSDVGHVYVDWEYNEFPKEDRLSFILRGEYEFIDDEQGDNAVSKSMQKGRVGDMIKVSTNDTPYTKGDLGRILATGNVSAEVEWIASTKPSLTGKGIIHYKDYEVVK